jgi:hypothetical protein
MNLGKVVLEDGTAVVPERVEAGLGAHDPVLARVVIAHHVPRHEGLASRRQLRQLKEQRVAVERHRILARDQLLDPRIVFHLQATIIIVVTFVEREWYEIVAVITTAARCRLCRRSGPGLLVLLVRERRPVRAARWVREDHLGVDGVGVSCSSVGLADSADGVVGVVVGEVVVAGEVLVVDFGLASVAEGEAEDGLEVVRGAVVLDLDARALALGPRPRDQLPQVLALLQQIK